MTHDMSWPAFAGLIVIVVIAIYYRDIQDRWYDWRLDRAFRKRHRRGKGSI